MAITADKMVTFIDSPNQTYPTDAKEYAHLAENYECIVEGNIKYFVSNKSALSNTADAIKAKVKIANFTRSNLSFRLDGSTDTITYTYTPSDSSCTLQIPGNTGNHSLYAYYNNDKVLSFDEKNNVMEYQSVSNVFKRSVNTLQRLIIGSDTIFTTSEHPFYVKTKGWVKAGMLSVGMLIQTSSAVAEVIENVEKDTLAEVYNFTVENTHTYVVGKNELIVHNTCKKLASVVEQMGDDADEFLNYLGTISSASRRTEIIDAAEIIQTAISGTTKFARDPQTLNKLADMAKSGSSWRNKRNSFWKSDLNDIIKTNNNVACLTCGTSGLIGRSRMDILLEDVDYIVANFNVTSGSNMEGLYTWLRGKAMTGGTPTSGQLDEVHQTISTIKREGLTDASIDAIGKTMANSPKKFDLKLVNGKYIELKNKNYTSGSLDVDDVDQVINGYFKEIDDINNFTWELKYVKNSSLGTVLEVENIMKTKWKNALNTPSRKAELFNSMKQEIKDELEIFDESFLTESKIEEIVNIFVTVKE